MHRIISSVASTIVACLRTVAGLACKLVAAPFTFAGRLLGGGAAAAAAAEGQQASAGRAAALAKQARSESDAAWVEQLEILKTVAKAIAAGRQPDQADVAALSPAVLRYASGLSPDDARLVASTGVGALKAHCKGAARVQGLPAFMPADGKHEALAAVAQATEPAQDIRAARAAEIKAGLRRGGLVARARVPA